MDKNPLQPQPGQTSLPEPVAHEQMPPVPGQAAQQVPPAPQAVPSPVDPSPATIPGAIKEEGDTLGQEWLTVVDNLVRQNIQDPRKLSKEFEKVKATYISKRYGKELKKSDSEG